MHSAFADIIESCFNIVIWMLVWALYRAAEMESGADLSTSARSPLVGSPTCPPAAQLLQMNPLQFYAPRLT